MEGLYIFNQTEILSLPIWYLPTLVIGGLIVGIISSLLIEKSRRLLFRTIGWVMFVVDLFCLSIFGLGWYGYQHPTGKYEYTVSIDDDAIRLLEFNEKYEIVRQHGELWIIRDK